MASSSFSQAPSWTVTAMRVGYAARAAVYVAVGGLALLAAFSGGNAEGSTGALAQLRDQSWGVPALVMIGLGLLCYMVWRLLDAAMDLECYGSDAKGLIARAGQTVTGLIHGALGFAALRLAFGQGSGGQAPQSLVSKLLALPWGAAVVIAVGLITIGAGGYYIYKGWSGSYKKHIQRDEVTERLDPVMKAGLIAHGIVIGIIGGFFVYAGLTQNSGQAGGMGRAFEALRGATGGPWLLAAVALGLLAFAIHCAIQARYRVVPRASEGEVSTLATRGKVAARKAMHSLKS